MGIANLEEPLESFKNNVDEQINERFELDLIEETDAEIAHPDCISIHTWTALITLPCGRNYRVLNSANILDDISMEDSMELIQPTGTAIIINTLDLLKSY
ncbi:hypothetical protein CEXT_722141 [Caerostris extrusa]|uniref:Uncharacterized protein n=1 Tax=Caerostris extrusa TaxID=172846 RepID=A0AAV4Y331_CAEEX|nr:hypothetical protein CEXT_722141 [Caerostris extrusa]